MLNYAHRRRTPLAAAVAGLAFGASSVALAQSSAPAIFVANNGNLEGSVSSFTLDSSGRPVLVAKLITGARANTQERNPGTNAYSMDLAPSGRFIAVGHTTESITTEQITLIQVNPDATLTQVGTASTPDTPLDLAWLSDTVLAVVATGLDAVVLYRFDAESGTLTEIEREAAGTGNSAIVVHPSGRWFYTNDTSGFVLRSFRVEADGSATLINTESTEGVYALGPGITRDGRFLYAGGGISGSGRNVVSFRIDPVTGVASWGPGSPFSLTDRSPKQAEASSDGRWLIVATGTDATVRTMSITEPLGILLPGPGFFDVGLQGTLGTVAVLPDGDRGDLVFVTDNSTALDNTMGLLTFRLTPDGGLVQNGAIVSTTGIAPTEIRTWLPACAADFDNSGQVDLFDYLDFASAFSTEDPRADLDSNGQVDLFDYLSFAEAFAEGC
ncbi:MAG: beta-propeller fold lactonase family protein [Planctomycetota bacterium]|nr:beta-propeller fold lactonase family protein [Planctomycetota bacterium]